MKKNKLPVLKISKIKWNQESNNNLPQELKVQWANQDWNFFEVSKWLSLEFNSTVNDLNIEQVREKKGSGWGGCC